MQRRLALLATPFLFSTLVAADTPPSLKLVDATLRLTRAPDGTGTAGLLVEADGFPKGKLPAGHPDVKLLPSLPPPTLADPVFVKEISHTDTSAVWSYNIKVTGSAQQSLVSRDLLLKFGDVQVTTTYTLTDKDAGTFAWSFPVQPAWSLIDRATIEIPVVVKDVRATGIRILSSSLARQGLPALSLSKEGLDLCANADGPCQPPADIGPSASQTLYVRIRNPSNGAYTGNLILACDQKSEGDTLPLTVNLTSSLSMVFGIVVVALGVGLYYLVTVFARFKMSENSRMQTALLLLRELDNVADAAKKSVATTSPEIQALVAQKVQTWEGNLAYASLHPYMPNLTDPNANLDEFKAYIQGEGLRVASFNIVTRTGLSEIAQAWAIAGAAPATRDARRNAVKTAVSDLLAIPDGKPTADETKAAVTRVIGVMDAAVEIHRPAGLAADNAAVQLHHLWLSTVRWNRMIVAVWFVISVLTGAWAMVLSKAGFGAAGDYVLCLLWGFGLVAAGAHLDQLSASDVNTKLGVGVSLPKTGS